MQQNTIAVVWDFDKTLVEGYMQEPIFKKFNVDGSKFWGEVNVLFKKYQEQGIKVNKDTIYLNHFITCTQQGIFKGLNNKMLRELGKDIKFYKGVPSIFGELASLVQNEKYQKYNIQVEHYIISTGLTEMIKGSVVNKYVNGIWGCEFIETTIKSELEIKEYNRNNLQANSIISQVAYAIDNTSKTRAIFEINKGVNSFPEMDVNSNVPKELRRIPINNMIYIADGPSDVPVFSLLKQYGGRTLGVYQKNNEKEFLQVDQLQQDGRIDMYGEADYSKGTQTYLWLRLRVLNIADRIYDNLENKVLDNISRAPSHITE